MNKITGSPKFKLALTDLTHMLHVALFIAGSAFATKMIELATQYDFGEYEVVSMAVINIIAALVKQFFADTQVEHVETVTDAGV